MEKIAFRFAYPQRDKKTARKTNFKIMFNFDEISSTTQWRFSVTFGQHNAQPNSRLNSFG